MPPPGMPRPEEAAYRTATESIGELLDRQAAARPNPGRAETFRRLNRTEYRNSIRDLLALDVNVEALLPSDEASHGFRQRDGRGSPSLAHGAVCRGGRKDQSLGCRSGGQSA